MFAYCENDPVNKSDPSGELCYNVIASAIGGAATSLAVYLATTKNVDAMGVITALATGTAIGALGGVTVAFRGLASVAAGVVSGFNTGFGMNGTTREKIAAGFTSGVITTVTTYFGTGIDIEIGVTTAEKIAYVYANAHLNFTIGVRTELFSRGAQTIAIKVSKAVSSAFESISKALSGFLEGW